MEAFSRTLFGDRLAAAVRRSKNPVVVGLDPRVEQLPGGICENCKPHDFTRASEAFVAFCRGVIDVVAPLVPAVKPQAACFEQLGPAGMQALGQVVRHAADAGLLVIMDGKRNDIGSTATAYADGFLGPESAWGADALTVSPYLGDDSLQPFVEVAQARGAGLFVLVKTSNPGGGQFQDLIADNRPLYRHVGEYVERLAGETLGAAGYGSVGAVVGATYPEQLTELREAMPRTWFLVPGFGSQGAGARDVAGAFDAQGLGAVINNSRGIIFAHAKPQFARFGADRWQDAVRAATEEMIEQLRAETSVGKLLGSTDNT
ncbi:MAG TPA: orotidine-5'-phosphate decarboxylase [Pirellulales bacterium]|nr:orotidine-5'-phosphate decarboxylase [Pirellulales bacterium]